MYITLLVKPCALCSALAEINYIEDDRNDLQNGRDTFTSTVFPEGSVESRIFYDNFVESTLEKFVIMAATATVIVLCHCWLIREIF